MTPTDVDVRALAKENAARAALELVEDGMTIGLGSGSTAEAFIALLGARMAEEALRIRALPTSEATRLAAEAAGISLLPIDQADRVDLCVDGADEVDSEFSLIKGGGGCLLREKIIANASDHFAVIVDGTKMVEHLGAFPLPVEVDPFGFTTTGRNVFDALRETGCEGWEVGLRADAADQPFVTDGGHYILDCAAVRIPDPGYTASALRRIPGVVEHGLFLDMARTVIVGDAEGAEIFER